MVTGLCCVGLWKWEKSNETKSFNLTALVKCEIWDV